MQRLGQRRKQDGWKQETQGAKGLAKGRLVPGQMDVGFAWMHVHIRRRELRSEPTCAWWYHMGTGVPRPGSSWNHPWVPGSCEVLQQRQENPMGAQGGGGVKTAGCIPEGVWVLWRGMDHVCLL